MFGGYRNMRKERRKSGLDGPLSNRIYVVSTTERTPSDVQLLELAGEGTTEVPQLEVGTGDTEDGTDEDSEVSFEEMLKREKTLEMKLKNKV